MPGLRKSEILRGRAKFRSMGAFRVLTRTSLLLCHYSIDSARAPGVKFAFIVSSRSHSSPQRNRIKRMLRASFGTHRHVWESLATRGETAVLVRFRGNRISHLKRQVIDRDVAEVCSALASTVVKENA